MVVLTLFSSSALTPDQWTNILTPLLSDLHTHAPFNNAAHKVLDRAGRVHQSTLSLPSPIDQAQCTHIIRSATIPQGLSGVLSPLSPFHKSSKRVPRLAVFDMDSTLIQQEVIDELARNVGCYDAVAAITEAAMRGDPGYADFSASLRARVALLKGVDGGVWQRLKTEVISFTPGARTLLACLKAEGWRTAVLSGGFIPLASWVKEELGLDYARANQLETDAGGTLTGRLLEGAEIVDGAKKRELLLQLAAENNVGRDAIIAVGDGSNDLPMMGEAALGIAFNAKPKVQVKAPAGVNGASLVDVLYVLGWTEEEIRSVGDGSLN